MGFEERKTVASTEKWSLREHLREGWRSVMPSLMDWTCHCDVGVVGLVVGKVLFPTKM